MSTATASTWVSFLEQIATLTLGPEVKFGVQILKIVETIKDASGESSASDGLASLFDKMEKEIVELIEQKIINDDISNFKSKVKGYGDNMDEYVENKTQANMVALIDSGNDLGEALISTDCGVIDEIPTSNFYYAVASMFVPMHLHVLRERWQYGDKLYEHPKTEFYYSELTKWIGNYKDYIQRVYKSLPGWRGSKATYHPYTSWHWMGSYAHANFWDTFYTPVKTSNTYYDSSESEDDSVGTWVQTWKDFQTYVSSLWVLDFANTVRPFLFLDNYSNPANDNIVKLKLFDPSLQTIRVGPTNYFYIDLESSEVAKNWNNMAGAKSFVGTPIINFDPQGNLVQIKAYDAGTSLIGLQFIYSSGPIQTIGTASGTPHVLDINPNEPIAEMTLAWVGAISPVNSLEDLQSITITTGVGNNAKKWTAGTGGASSVTLKTPMGYQFTTFEACKYYPMKRFQIRYDLDS